MMSFKNWFSRALDSIKSFLEKLFKKDEPLPPVIPLPKFEYDPVKLLGVGPCVNWWPINNAGLIADELLRNGSNSTLIEVLGKVDSTSDTYENPDLIKELLVALVTANRERKITTVLVGTNDNKGKSGGKKLIDFLPQLKDLGQFILDRIGPEGVIVQPVAEQKTEGGFQFEQWFMPKLIAAGFVTASENGGQAGGFATSITIRHPGSTADKGRPGQLIVTDSQILRELSVGGDYDHNMADPQKLAAYAKAVKANGCGFIHYAYGPGSKKDPDIGAIRALKGIGSGGSTPTPTPTPVTGLPDWFNGQLPIITTGPDINSWKERAMISNGRLGSASPKAFEWDGEDDRSKAYGWPVDGKADGFVFIASLFGGKVYASPADGLGKGRTWCPGVVLTPRDIYSGPMKEWSWKKGDKLAFCITTTDARGWTHSGIHERSNWCEVKY